MQIRTVLSCFILLHIVIGERNWNKCLSGTSCKFTNITLTSDFHLPSSQFTRVILDSVTIPDPSSELFKRLLRGIQQFVCQRCTLAKVHITVNLIDLRIEFPNIPVDIITNPNTTYALKRVILFGVSSALSMQAVPSLERYIYDHAYTPIVNFEMFSGLQNLSTVSVSNASVKEILMKESLKLPSLLNLDLTDNELSTLNVSTSNFPALETLDLRNNKFIVLPEHLLGFEKLTKLILDYNLIQRVDDRHLKHVIEYFDADVRIFGVHFINMYGNPWNSSWLEKIRKGKKIKTV